MAYGAAPGLVPDSGIIIKDPLLEQSPGGIWKVVQGSPAVDSATRFADTVFNDFELQARSDGLPDIGADELSDEPGEVLPVMPEDVGPDWQDSTVFVKTNGREQFVQIYPNPATDRFSIAMDESLLYESLGVELFDISGRKVLAREFLNVTENIEIHTGGLKGLYLVKIHFGNRTKTARVILGK